MLLRLRLCLGLVICLLVGVLDVRGVSCSKECECLGGPFAYDAWYTAGFGQDACLTYNDYFCEIMRAPDPFGGEVQDPSHRIMRDRFIFCNTVCTPVPVGNQVMTSTGEPAETNEVDKFICVHPS